MRGLQWLLRTAGNAYLEHPLVGPVSREVFSTQLRVEGEVPSDMNGAYIRTGPNPQHKPWGGYHWCAADPTFPAPLESHPRPPPLANAMADFVYTHGWA